MAEEEILTERVRKRKMRMRFMYYIVVVFCIFAVVSFFVLPILESKTAPLAEEINPTAEKGKDFLKIATTFFKYSFVLIALGCVALGFLAWTGKIDELIPLLQFVLLLAGMAAVVIVLFGYYSRVTSMVDQLT